MIFFYHNQEEGKMKKHWYLVFHTSPETLGVFATTYFSTVTQVENWTGPQRKVVQMSGFIVCSITYLGFMTDEEVDRPAN